MLQIINDMIPFQESSTMFYWSTRLIQQFNWRQSCKMERLVIFFAFIVLILMIETADGDPSCLDDNTAYYGNNLNSPWNRRNRGIDDIKGSSSECQRACANHPRCNYWSWHKDGLGWCYLKRSKPTYHPRYGIVYAGNNRHYVSGSKHCTHVS